MSVIVDEEADADFVTLYKRNKLGTTMSILMMTRIFLGPIFLMASIYLFIKEGRAQWYLTAHFLTEVITLAIVLGLNTFLVAPVWIQGLQNAAFLYGEATYENLRPYREYIKVMGVLWMARHIVYYYELLTMGEPVSNLGIIGLTWFMVPDLFIYRAWRDKEMAGKCDYINAFMPFLPID